MKKILITLALVATTAASFAQGKITLGNDSLHLITVDGALAPVSGGFSALTMQLYGGLNAGSMALQTTIVGNAINSLAVDPGRINNTSVLLTGIATSTSASFQLVFFPTASGSYSAAAAAGLGGASPVFTMTTGNFAYNFMVSHIAPSLSTWPDAPMNVTVIPEPTSMVLAGLGAASLLLFRRRN